MRNTHDKIFGIFLLLAGMALFGSATPVSKLVGEGLPVFTPALTALAAFLFMSSPMGWRRGIAVGLGVAGVVVIHLFKGEFTDESSQYFYLGVVLVLAAISCEACYTLIGKKATEHLPPLFTTFMACAMSIPLFLLLALIDYREVEFGALTVTSWGALVWWGVGTLGAGSALWYSGVSRAEGTTAAGFMAVMPLSALVLSYMLLGEAFRPVHSIGIALVLASVAIMSSVHAGAMKKKPEEAVTEAESKEAREARLLCSCHCSGLVPPSLQR